MEQDYMLTVIDNIVTDTPTEVATGIRTVMAIVLQVLPMVMVHHTEAASVELEVTRCLTLELV